MLIPVHRRYWMMVDILASTMVSNQRLESKALDPALQLLVELVPTTQENEKKPE